MPEKHYPPIEKALKKYYGYDAFRPGQLELIHALLDGQDVCGVMPTGAGKSVCFQIPAIFLEGLTLVISPLISLMQDQVAALCQARIPAAYLNSSLTLSQYNKALSFAKQGRYKIIYVAPERLNTPGFLDFAHSVNISMIAIDEAHCVSQWGQSFRPSYMEIAKFASSLPKRPILAAFTATATGVVKQDIIEFLGLQNPKILVTGFDRTNLFFEVQRPTNKKQALLRFLKKHPDEAGIIYCQTRKETEEVSDFLKGEGYLATCYHGGMDTALRTKAQEEFLYDQVQLICATTAFGMGIDKSNVRFVVHYSMPSSLENYYQEAGRAGRDGAPAHCVLFFQRKDIGLHEFLIQQTCADTPEQLERDLHRLRQMVAYCETPLCLRAYILQYFGETLDHDCSGCSNCQADWISEDITKEATIIYEAIQALPHYYGMPFLASFLKGKKTARMKELGFLKNKYHGALSDLSESRIRQILEYLISKGYLRRSDDRYQTLSIGHVLEKAMQEEDEVFLQRKAQGQDLLKKHGYDWSKDKKIQSSSSSLNPNQAQSTLEAAQNAKKLLERLKATRMTIARQYNLPPYLVVSDAALLQMVRDLPQTKDDLLKINGIGVYKCNTYGPAFLSVLQSI